MKYKYKIILTQSEYGSPRYIPVYAPVSWPFDFGFRGFWRGAIALVTLPFFLTGVRFGWKGVIRVSEDWVTSMDEAIQVCDKHAIAAEQGKPEADAIAYTYNPYPKIMEQQVKETQYLVENASR